VRLPDFIQGLGPKADKPRLNPGADLSAHRLTPVEGFVLSRIDGTASYDQICVMTGLGVEATVDVLRRLRRNGLILGSKDTVPPAAQPPGATPVLGVPVTAAKQRLTPSGSVLERLDDGSPIDPAELTSGPDLSIDTKTRILRLHRRLKSLGPYEMLGLPPGADRSLVKRAYFSASKELHPDRFFGKDIGIFREKLGDIFARMTEAFQSIGK
jgi:hypothetical protein